MKNIKGPRIIFWDIEVSPTLTTTWGIHQQFLTINNIIKDWYIISIAWKYAGDSKVHAVSAAKPYDDYSVVKKVREVLCSADLIVHHYGDAFDLKKFNARLIYHQLPPLPDIPTLDTKKAAAKIANFTSNKLEYLATMATGTGKIKTDYDLWLRCMRGDKKAVKEMVAYNKVDVIKLEEWYNWLKPYIKNHPHIWAKYQDRFHTCRNCGSTDIKKNGTRPTKAGVLKQETQCRKCGAYERIPITKV